VYKTAQVDRTLALVAAGVGLSFVPARLETPGVKMVQVADMDFFRTYGLLWSREREEDLKEFITFAESFFLLDTLRTDRPHVQTEPGLARSSFARPPPYISQVWVTCSGKTAVVIS
jgi:hypothetical protein